MKDRVAASGTPAFVTNRNPAEWVLANANLGFDLTDDPRADAHIDAVRAQAATWLKN